jgi:type III secretory pathway component EscV
MSKAGLKDYFVPFAVVGMLGVMIVPLPFWLLDILLSFNLAFAVLFLISAIFLQEPQRFTSLPTVLLLTTVCRLSLNISTTRSVLAGGEIPQVVVAFGDFVVGGNMVVGAVVFSIITLVQFLVIAKGAERVAEVAARFTLDAMPGKQMAIDADLRAGAISLADARVLRRDLQTESKLFGSLDGAMKFVKGDAIAGIIITSINLVAGVFIGCVQQNLSFQHALNKFGIFTIGDGLVSQMPALVVAAAAGIAITRVADQEQPMLGRAIIAQLAGDSRVLYTAAVVLTLLAITPGIPWFPFIVAAGVLAIVGFSIVDTNPEEIKKLRTQSNQAILIAVSQNALSELHKEARLMDTLHEIRQKHYEKWGVITPDFEFKLNQDLLEKTVNIEFSDIKVSTIKLKADQSFTSQIEEKLQQVLVQLNPSFINDRQTRTLLDQNYLEDTVNSIVPEMISITSLTKI